MNESLCSELGQSAYICRSITAVLIMSDEAASGGTEMGGWSVLWLRCLPALGASMVLALVMVQGAEPQHTAAVDLSRQHAVVDTKHLSVRPLAGTHQIPDRISFRLMTEHRRVEGAARPAADPYRAPAPAGATPEPSLGQARR